MGDDTGEIYLSPACIKRVTRNMAKIEPVRGPGVLIFEKDIKVIMFLDRPDSACHNLWKDIEFKAKKGST